ncbi:hypothetical protein A3D71_03450 [Candidatus Kaiserbacteria bacterium RIFCSPHIGHO2_02_FULL_55_20]|uniref:Blue (type 1) copper domain-containing protein n=1 Tax=Candidatus Kaiserbacteria bacterium RIFCSPHIGHO2_02_FULL_55_20 TaxID=1798497 RepID=A0A1F6DVH7_9BACT|nr:MAG: hypothetical protein A2680_04265 [Candidatus Kaiserbacteria bacterium RIFCSPHIGHO2_01_FULL_55_37]OGG65270.1 MAG: hypothetical protein A3D71_03450 [Candidatus Kaiserbacteria bacterium RIFCSPHIGHO2_02_FULL_55_20]
MLEEMSPQKLAIAVLAFIILASSVYFLANTKSPAPTAADAPNAALDTGNIPPLTDRMKSVLAKSHGFAALVSYTDRGFEPDTVTIKKGEAIRFTNNSSQNLLWVASVATGTAPGSIYPTGQQEPCGQSAFDSCATLEPHEFWEFTFDVAGAWSYADNLHKDRTGIVRVQ